MKQLLTSLLLLVSTFFSFAQEAFEAEKFKAALFRTKTGAKLVYNGEMHSFTLQLEGKIEPTEAANFLTLNNNILQIMHVPFMSKQDFENMSIESQKKNLLGHMRYELDYFKEILKTKNLKETAEFVTINDKLFLYWTYQMPKMKNKSDQKSVEKQAYWTTVCFDQILIINRPLQKVKETEDAKEEIIKIAKTLVLNDFPIDLENLYNELNKE
ncbi:MAG: hypothetical protein PHQ74_09815 [Crocinitomicaceae bacterium]|nr:hypothetical protein [Crocinitomicaceae bacterium]